MSEFKPKVLIADPVYRKIMHFVNKSNYEVSGLGTLTRDDKGIFRITDIMLLPQKNGATQTDIEADDVGKLMFALRKSPGDLRFWWHSHVDMSVFWSQTDMDTIAKIGAGGWFLSTVFNKKREMRSAFYAVAGMQTPWGSAPLFVDNLPTEVANADADTSAWDEEYRLNVTNVMERWSGGYGYGGYEGAGYPSRWTGNGYHAPSDAFIPPELTGHPSPARPPGVSKKAWKKLKRERRLEKLEAPAIVTVDDDEAMDYDNYGFSPQERAFLAERGWDIADIDELVDDDVRPVEILTIAAADWTPQDIEQWCSEQHCMPHDVVDAILREQKERGEKAVEAQTELDIPVMDRAAGGKYDA